jgi:arylsulfatase A-like enzyme
MHSELRQTDSPEAFSVPLVFLFTFLALTAPDLGAQTTTPPSQPNIVFIVADDLGYGDLSSYGSEIIETPHIDALARGGVRFTQAYVSHSVCSPSRAGFLTGRNQVRHGWEFNPAGRDARVGMRLQEKTLANRLAEQGYRTGMVGKWHLGQQKPYHPMSRGFDEYFGILEGGSIYIDSRAAGVEFAGLGPGQGPTERLNKVLRGFDEVKVDRYLTDVFTDEAVAFIEKQNQDRPFFLYLSHTTPHTPLQATAHYLEPYRHIDSKRHRIYAAMVAALDESVRRVVASLEQKGIYDNTLILFMSDNGCAGYIDACSNGELFGYKRYHHEGGVRVPMIASWPKQLPAGKVYDQPVSSLDTMATFTAAAGQSVETEDSVDLLPFLKGEKASTPHEALYWRAGPTRAIRQGRYKLIELKRTDKRQKDLDIAQGLEVPGAGFFPLDTPLGKLTLLYDIEADPGETHSIADQNPEIVRRLKGLLDRWQEELAEPIQPPVRSTVFEIEGEWVQLLF